MSTLSSCSFLLLVALRTFAIWGNFHHDLVPDNFLPRKGNYIPISSHSTLSPPLSPWGTTNLPSISMNLHVLDISYPWNPTICGLVFWLLSLGMFSRFIHVSELHSFFVAEQPSAAWAVAHLVYPSMLSWSLECFYLLAVLNNAAVNVHVHDFV